MISSCIYNGNVIHKRFKPKEHFFKYKVFSLFIDLSELNELNDKLKFFSLNKFNLIRIKILRTYGNSYDFEYSQVNNPQKINRGTVNKISD